MLAFRTKSTTLSAWVALFVVGCNYDPAQSGPQAGPAKTVRPSAPAVEPSPVITLTPAAVKAISQIVTETQSKSPLYLRLRVELGGCSGCQHKLDLDQVISPAEDHVFEVRGIKVVVWKRQVEMLRCTEIDYVDTVEKRGFSVKNGALGGPDSRKWMLALVREAAKDKPDDASVQYGLGGLLMEHGQHAEAVKALERAVELNPKFVLAYQRLGECLTKLGQKDRAVEVLSKGWTLADAVDYEEPREAMTKLLNDLGAAVPQASSKQQP